MTRKAGHRRLFLCTKNGTFIPHDTCPTVSLTASTVGPKLPLDIAGSGPADHNAASDSHDQDAQDEKQEV